MNLTKKMHSHSPFYYSRSSTGSPYLGPLVGPGCFLGTLAILAQSAGRCLFHLFDDRCRVVDGFGREIEVNEAQLFLVKFCVDRFVLMVSVILFFAKCDDCDFVCTYVFTKFNIYFFVDEFQGLTNWFTRTQSRAIN
jgi:hypothetical protein